METKTLDVKRTYKTREWRLVALRESSLNDAIIDNPEKVANYWKEQIAPFIKMERKTPEFIRGI
jgi:hypothetical protein